jgi:spore germination protein YaaH
MKHFLHTLSVLAATGLASMVLVAGIAPAAPALAATTAKKPAVAATPFSRSAWLPYWKKNEGAAEITPQLTPLANFSPFAYGVLPGGIVYDAGMDIGNDPWPALFTAAQKAKTKIYPTIMWSDADEMDHVLGDPTLRKLHEDMIMSTIVSQPNFAGVDIDYENKNASTSAAFSSFIKELGTRVHAAAGSKKLICTVEPRTPIEARYTNPTDAQRQNIAYANDYTVLNKYCDQIRVMAYDQGTIDVQLNAAKGGLQFYAPVADPAWVSKVVTLAEKDIAPSKIVLGIPTYGYVWDLTLGSDGTWQYSRSQAIDYKDALDLAQSVHATPVRNSAGELSFAYVGPSSVASGGTGLRLVWFSDGRSVADKVALAHQMKLGGVVLFKADGGSDPAVWTALAK